jgi:hypothetical protein
MKGLYIGNLMDVDEKATWKPKEEINNKSKS